MKADKPVLVERKQSAEAGYHPQVWYEGWRVAYLNDTPQFHRENVKQMQRHNTSDEVFVLLEGSLTLCIGDGTGETPGRVTEMELERGVIYNVKKGVWHTHITGEGTKVLIVENANVSSENSDYAPFCRGEGSG